MNLARIKSDIEHFGYDLLRTLSPIWGKVLLSRQRSFDRLKSGVRSAEVADPVLLSQKSSLNGQLFFAGNGPEGERITFEPDFVWKIAKDNQHKSLRVLPSGNPVLNGHWHLNLDFSPIKGLIEPHKITGSEESLIICWPHGWGAYYDFILFILSKWCRMEDALGKEIWTNSKVAYARLNFPFEDDFIQLMGIPADRVIDSRKLTGSLETKEMILANCHGLFYPSPADVQRIRNRLAPPTGKQPTRKIYLSRAKTRRLLCESEIRPLLEKHGIEFIEDVPRTVEAQIALFREASLIIGPHGAGFANMIWAPPGAKVVEFFHPHYYPPYFYYLAQVLGHSYDCWLHPDAAGSSQHIASRYDDVDISLAEFEKVLVEVMESYTSVSTIH